MKATFLLEVEHVDQLNDIRETLMAIPGVHEVRRVLGPGVGPEKVSGTAQMDPDLLAANGSLNGRSNGKPVKHKKKEKTKPG